MEPAYEGPGTLSPVVPSSLVGDGHDNVHVVHTTILTFPAKSGKDRLTAIYGPDGTSLINDETTIQLAGVPATKGVLSASMDPGSRFATPQQLVTVNGAEYTVDPIKKGGFELIGQSTTVLVLGDDTRSSRTVGHLALATGASTSSHSDESVDAGSASREGSSSASSPGVKTALATCVYLSLLAIFMALFM